MGTNRPDATKGGPTGDKYARGRLLHWLYLIGIWFKGIDGILELIGGVLFLLVSKATLSGLVFYLTQHELSQDPGDWVGTHLRHAVSHLSANTKIFASAYLLGHGVVKVFLVWGGLLRRRMWAFPTALALIGAFVVYQSYRTIHRFSLGLTILTAIDIIVWFLILREYRIAKARGTGHQRT